MKEYSIMRLAKHKSLSSLAGFERHGMQRERLKHRAKPEKSCKNLFYKKYPELTVVQAWKKMTEKISIRKNGVFAIEYVFSVSPTANDKIEQEAELWSSVNLNWLSHIYGRENILYARTDLDETTINAHVLVLPLVETLDKNGNKKTKLCARYFINGADKLSQMQTSYAEAIAEKFPFLSRGNCYLDTNDSTKPRHQSLKEYYRKLELAESKKISARVKEMER